MKTFAKLVWKMVGKEVHLELEGVPLQIGDHIELLARDTIIPLVILDKKVDSCDISFSAKTTDTNQDIAYLLKEGQLCRRVPKG